MRKTFKAGEVLFAEGDPSDSVFRIISGTVDVLRDLGGKSILLGSVGEGEFLGEMGVIEFLPRNATATASNMVEVMVLEPAEFLDRVSTDPEAARELISRLSARLRDVDDRLVSAIKGAPAKTNKSVAGGKSGPLVVKLAAGSPVLERQIGTEARAVAELPYIVGRPADKGEADSGIPLDLAIEEPAPHRLSQSHFILLEEWGEAVVRDLCSGLGTIVNARSIGRDFPTDVASLVSGENEVIAGGRDSPYRFSIIVG